MSVLVTPMTTKRIQKEIADLRKDKDQLGDIILIPSDDLLVWKASIPGPDSSPYEGGVFNVDIRLNPDYPFSAPRVQFLTRIYHMNISDRGAVCLDILKHNWSPALSLFKLVLSLSSLLTDPNPRDPLVPSIAIEYSRNKDQHDRNARHWTELYAKPRPPQNTNSTERKQKIETNTQPSSEPIEIEDSDNEGSGSMVGALLQARGSTRKRRREKVEGVPAQGTNVRNIRRRTDTPQDRTPAPPDVIEIDD